MDRRKSIKALAAGVVAPKVLLHGAGFRPDASPGNESNGMDMRDFAFASDWHNWPDMAWVGPAYWGNRLQDWRIENGSVVCVIRGRNRTLHSLVCQLSAAPKRFETNVIVKLIPKEGESSQYAGFRVGARATERYDDYRCAAVFGDGLDAGLRSSGKLFIGDSTSPRTVDPSREVSLSLRAMPEKEGYRLQLTASDPKSGKTLDTLTVDGIAAEKVQGNIALVSHDGSEQRPDYGVSVDGYSLNDEAWERRTHGEDKSVTFSNWKISGAKISYHADHEFGPVLFAQYTVNRNILKLTAQLAPVDAISGHKVSLQLRQGTTWKTVLKGTIDPEGRAAHFRLENWDTTVAVPYRVRLELPLHSGVREYFYEGTIAAEPVHRDELKVAVFCCNGDGGFPDTEIAPHVAYHKPDMAVFLGDQFYESHGGFRIEPSPPDKAALDYLRKWYMFGWSYRDTFRHIPCAIMPDDHDVYHGNVWGEGGKHAPSDEGWNYVAQDQGGYKMSAAWVNMIQRTQTSHLPDAYDSRPVKQGIGVYYGDWTYAGISFAILEDRKFKSAPKNVLPPEAGVENGFITNLDFDIRAHRDVRASLLGDRQMSFLETWASDWRGVVMKAVLSQTNFCTLATLPKGSTGDSMVPRLPIYDEEVYVEGDAPTTDMDSNGWPQNERDAAVRLIRKCFAFHIAGDQHIASFVQYGVDEFGDSGFAFTGPALNNVFPRRWWPPVNGHTPLVGSPPYTGDFHDGFGNRITVHAVANPRKTGVKPALVYDRATGYGLVTFNKDKRTIHTECWPRFVDPAKEPNGQYKGWPQTVSQEDNFGRKAAAWLPEVVVTGAQDPVVEIIAEATGESVYVMRIRGTRFKPKVFAPGNYTVKVSDPDRGLERIVAHVQSSTAGQTEIKVDLG